MISTKELPLPPFFDGNKAAEWGFRPDQAEIVKRAYEWVRANGIKPAASDGFSLHVLLIDVQKDFCFPEGSLYVAGRSGTGAIDDNRRLAEFIYRNLSRITDITTTLDTHFAYQIFFAPFWETADDEPLSPHTLVDLDDTGQLVNLDLAGNVLHRGVRPIMATAKWVCGKNYPWLLKQMAFYASELRKGGKYTLYLWPYHCLLGSEGHVLAGIIHEARLFHALCRGSQSWCEVKGGHTLTENYSVFSPEVRGRHDGKPLAQRNTELLRKLMETDALVIAGQAASHCVKSSIDDLLGDILAQDPKLAKKVFVLQDCMSSVTIPDGKGGFAADFTDEAEAALKRFADKGMHLVKSTDPLDSWPDLGIA